LTNKLWSWFRRRRAPQRELIVNADDFGMSAAVNAGIIKAAEYGIVTSASLMVRREAAAAAAVYARSHPSLSVGLHVDLGEWIRRNDQWQPLYVLVDLERRDDIAVEVQRQVDLFRDLIGANPTHLDSHQHVHRSQSVAAVLLEIAAVLDVPLRHFTSAVRYCGQFYGQEQDGRDAHDAITAPRLINVVNHLDAGVTELCCHPADRVQLGEQYGSARPKELATLCDTSVRAAIDAASITLRSFHGLRAAVTMEPRQMA
jgi:predicted glycoside hydrolase/deacetylase ChbG (UPF0249 family)